MTSAQIVILIAAVLVTAMFCRDWGLISELTYFATWVAVAFGILFFVIQTG